MQLHDHRLYLLFTPERAGSRPWRVLDAALRGGVDLVQWRSKARDDDGFQRCRELCQERTVPLIVNDDVMLAIRERAHGAHVGQDDMPAGVARRLLERGWLGVSTHDLAQLAAAEHAGADYVGFGPCFPTATKGYEQGLGPAAIEAAVAAARVPLFAIGGVGVHNVQLLYGLGVRRNAVCGAILDADDPEAAAATLRAAL
ncbi:MAG: thiamine phosphate synthase [Planctomycetota bacterium]